MSLENGAARSTDACMAAAQLGPACGPAPALSFSFSFSPFFSSAILPSLGMLRHFPALFSRPASLAEPDLTNRRRGALAN